MENKDLFDEALETTPEHTEPAQKPENIQDAATEDLIDDDFEVKLNDESQEELEERKGVKAVANGRILTIKEVEIMPPKTKKLVDGETVRIDPSTTQNKGVQYYPSKLKVRYEEDNLTEYYPTISFWINEGKINPNVKLDRMGNSKIAQMIRMALQKMSKNVFELKEARINERPTLIVTEETKKAFMNYSKTVSDKEILDWLIGKKVEIETTEGYYNNNPWFRNDWKKIIVE